MPYKNPEDKKKWSKIYNHKYYKEHRDYFVQYAKSDGAKKQRKEYVVTHREDRNTKNKRYRRKIRMEVLSHYGGKCACCGEDRYEFLAIDHINGGGKKHTQSIRKSLYWWIKVNDYPNGFRVLCHNCNCAYGFYGYCPHIKERTKR